VNTVVTISYSLQANGGNELPGWVNLDSANKLLNFTIPLVTQSTNYTFNVVATESGVDYIQTMVLEVEKEEEIEEYIMPKSVQATQTTTQAASSAGIGFAALSSLFSGSSPQAMWVMMNQIQLILLLPVLVDYMPDDVSYFIFWHGQILIFLQFHPNQKHTRNQRYNRFHFFRPREHNPKKYWSRIPKHTE
jgi:hypothetical protein